MPELPEVQTTITGLSKVLPGLTIRDVWSDLPTMKITRSDYRDTIKYLPFWKKFKKEVTGKKILNVERRAKNILINISDGNPAKSAKADNGASTILIHMKMTGHIMVGQYELKKNTWLPHEKEKNNALRDPYNRFIHFVIVLTDGKHMVLSDTRKFAKVTLISSKDAHNTVHLKGLGPEPLHKDFKLENFIDRLQTKKTGKIKSVLMDPTVIAGIGNIYSDEMLWLSGIHPEEQVVNIPKDKIKLLYNSMQKVLAKGIDFGGDSMSDYRNVEGKRGKFQNHHNAYRKKGERCGKKGCHGVIIRKVIGGRSAHFCSVHQKLIKK